MYRPARSGVIYAGTRKAVEALADRLSAAGVPALAYHSGLDPEVRASRLGRWWRDRNESRRALAALDDDELSNLSEPGLQLRREARRAGRGT